MMSARVPLQDTSTKIIAREPLEHASITNLFHVEQFASACDNKDRQPSASRKDITESGTLS
jgi:hypothetical protein